VYRYLGTFVGRFFRRIQGQWAVPEANWARKSHCSFRLIDIRERIVARASVHLRNLQIGSKATPLTNGFADAAMQPTNLSDSTAVMPRPHYQRTTGDAMQRAAKILGNDADLLC
jgi:hypothetical protein